MLIHLLNMLIAMMGNIYNTRVRVADQVRIRDHLRFVVDNWYLCNVAFKKDKKKLKYIICAFLEKKETSSEDKLDELAEEVHEMNLKFEKDIGETIYKQKEMQEMLVGLS